MAITIQGKNGAIVARELFEGFRKGIGPQGPSVEKVYLVEWSASDDFANTVLGLTFGVGGVAGTIVRQAPHRCPESDNLFALNVGPIEGWGTPVVDAGRPRWSHATVPVFYGVPTFQMGGSLNTIDPFNLMNFDQTQVYPYASQSIDYDSESYTTDKGWRYVGGSAPGAVIVDSHTTVDVPVAVMAITLHRVPFLPKAALNRLVKCVNDAGFLDEPAGTVLFDKYRTSLQVNTDGTSTQDLDLVLKWRRVGHNMVPDPADNSTWIPFSHDGTSGGRKAYAAKDLRPILFGVNLNVTTPDTYPNPFV